MSRIRLYPHRQAREDCWTPDEWTVKFGDATEPVSRYQQAFDPAMRLAYGFQFCVDCRALLRATGVGKSARVAVYGSVDCAEASIRLTSFDPVDLRSSETIGMLWVEADPGMLAGSVRLERGIVLLSGAEDAELKRSRNAAAAPTAGGSRLLDDDAVTTNLEGTFARFPIEAVSFKSLFRNAAAWVVSSTFDAPGDSFLSAVRLLVNTDHGISRSVLATTDDDVSNLTRSVLRVDIVRQLLLEAVRIPEFLHCNAGGLDEGTVGAVLDSICVSHVGMNLAETLDMLQSDPSGLDSILQESLGYLDPPTRP